MVFDITKPSSERHTSQVLFNHGPATVSHSFDEDNLISPTGLVPIMRLAAQAGLTDLAANRLSVSKTAGDKGANPAAKLATLIAGMIAGADSIDDMDQLRHQGMKKLFDRVCAPSTLGSFLRSFAFGHVRQLDAISSRLLTNLDRMTPLGSRGLNALIATASTPQSGQVSVGQRLRKGSTYSARGADKFVSDTLAATTRMPTLGQSVLLRADSAYYSSSVAKAADRAGADISITVRMDQKIKAAIASISDDAWTGIEYPQAIWDDDAGAWISTAEVAEIDYTAFSSKKQALHIPGRLIVRRVPELNENKRGPGQAGLFEICRYHAFFTTVGAEVLDTVAADKVHRRHAIIEQIHAGLKNGPLGHMPSGVFNANAAWLTIAAMTHNLLRAVAGLVGGAMARVRAPTLRARIITVPARIAHRARKLVLHLPTGWAWQSEFDRLWAASLGPPATITA